MTSANEATMDPVRTNATKDLTPESRPEVTEGTSALPADTNVPKGMAAVESQPINEGVLAYKQPGLVKYGAPLAFSTYSTDSSCRSLMYSKKFFWFSDEPVEHKHLTGYLRGEKATDIARPNAAHASQTGKGLLFFAKRAEDKPQPQGIINLVSLRSCKWLHDLIADPFSVSSTGRYQRCDQDWTHRIFFQVSWPQACIPGR